MDVPTVIVHGAKDRLVPLAKVDFLERELCRLDKTSLFMKMICSDYNHLIPWDTPKRSTTRLNASWNPAPAHHRGDGV